MFLPVDRHTALLDIVEAEQDARDRRLAGARRPYDGDHLAGRNLERHVVQNAPFGIMQEKLTSSNRIVPSVTTIAVSRPACP